MAVADINGVERDPVEPFCKFNVVFMSRSVSDKEVAQPKNWNASVRR